MRRTLAILCLFAAAASAQTKRWTEQQARDWYSKQGWLVGANYIPANAINQLEMWQAETFDPARIDKELGWAASIGMNTMRVFLHDLAWQKDPAGMRFRINRFLAISAKHGIKPMFVLFDSCWDPFPHLGTQRAPTPGVHNSGWVQGPGAKALQDKSQHARLEAYVKDVVKAFGQDDRVLAWDVWNEPDNMNNNSYGPKEPANKVEMVAALLPKTYEWVRSASPKQPVTSGVWRGDWAPGSSLTPIQKTQLEMSDVISFHNYGSGEDFRKAIKSLQPYNRPILCTEYMARGNNSTFEGSMPVAKEYGVAAYNWGLVAGKTQTYLPWDSWKKPYVGGHTPKIWFHEVFKEDGTPYRKEETELIRRLTARPAKRKAA